MIRTLAILTAFAAVAGAANATEIKVSVVGKDTTAISAELNHAAKLVCQDTSVSDYAPCVAETYQNAMQQALKIKAVYK